MTGARALVVLLMLIGCRTDEGDPAFDGFGASCDDDGACDDGKCGSNDVCTNTCLNDLSCPPGWACDAGSHECECREGPEYVDGFDNDCDGSIDEEGGPPPDDCWMCPESCSYGRCVDPGPSGDDGGVAGDEGALRLDPASGRLEVFHSGQWGTICDDNFYEAAANVACRQLRYSGGTPFVAGGGMDPIWMDDVSCSGVEMRLMDCAFSGWGMHNCSHEQDVGVSCY